MECLQLHESLLVIFEEQIKSYKTFEKSFLDKEKKIFGINGKDTYKKDFEIYFGNNANNLHELMLLIT